MIHRDENTSLPLDLRVVSAFQRSRRFEFDSNYMNVLHDINGAKPSSLYFRTTFGEIRQIAWFVSFIDRDSVLEEPFQPAMYYAENDLRVDDISLPGILDDEVGPYWNAERIVPFAALYTDLQRPSTLRMYSYNLFPGDSLCFDRATAPHSIVLCSGQKGAEEAIRWEDSDDENVNYAYYVQKVADSFASFEDMLFDEVN